VAEIRTPDAAAGGNADRSIGGSRRGWLVALGAGVALGAVNSLSSALGSPYHPMSLVPDQGVRPLQYLAAWLGTRWAWAVLAFFIGWSSRRLRSGIPRALGGLWLAVFVYYLSDLGLGTNDELSGGEVVIWSVIVIVTAPIMATLGWLARRPAPWRLLAALTAPALMAADTAWAPTGPDSIRPGAQWWVYAGATVLTVVLLVTHRRTRP